MYSTRGGQFAVHSTEGPDWTEVSRADSPLWDDRPPGPATGYPPGQRRLEVPRLDDRDAWIAVCFVIRAGYRRHGLMHHLLTGAVQHATAHGAQVVEGYPVDAAGGRVDVISGSVGTVVLFEPTGFQRAAVTTGHGGGQPRWVMRSCAEPRIEWRPLRACGAALRPAGELVRVGRIHVG